MSRTAVWLSRERAIAWSGALLAEQLLLLGAVVLWAYGFLGPSRPPIPGDFMSFYAAGRLVLEGTPHLAYDAVAHWQVERLVAGDDVSYNYFFYPPPFLLVCAALARLPYIVALLLFEAGTLLFYVLVARRIARIGGWAWIIPALAFPSVVWNLGLGQNACLTAALFGCGLLQVDTRPIRGGILLGLLCYKPHFGLLIPVALVAGGRWRACGAAALTVGGIVGVTAILFGTEVWARYFASFVVATAVYESGQVLLAGFVTPFGAARLLGLSVHFAYGVQAVTSVVAAGLVALVWRRPASLAVRATMLMACSLLSVHLALIYDLTLLSVCIAWIVREGCENGFLRGEKGLIVGVYGISLVSFAVGVLWHVPIGPLAPAAIVLICLRRIAAQVVLSGNRRGESSV